MHPVLAGRFANDAGLLVSHVIAFETSAESLALIDTGIGVDARRDPRTRLGTALTVTARPSRDPAQAVVAQLEARGYARADVRDIFLTHLDIDHAAGLSDFPDAVVHVHQDELAAALDPPSRAERERYIAANWAHDVQWAAFGSGAPEATDLGPKGYEHLAGQVVALPLPGHTRGHTGYAIRDGDGWLLHAGDAFYHEATLDPSSGARASRFLRIFERAAAVLPDLLAARHRELQALARDAAVEVVCSHDPALLRRARQRAEGVSGAGAPARPGARRSR